MEYEFNKVNDIISPDLIVEINSLFASLEFNCVDILDQMKKMCNITSYLNNLLVTNVTDTEALKFLKSLFNEKYLSLKNDSKKYHIFKNRKLTCPGHFNIIIKNTIADIKATIEVKETKSMETDTGRSTKTECRDCKESLNAVDINLEGGLIHLCKTCLATLLQNPNSKPVDEIAVDSSFSPIVNKLRNHKIQPN